MRALPLRDSAGISPASPERRADTYRDATAVRRQHGTRMNKVDKEQLSRRYEAL